MATITMAVDCGKDETKVSILGSDQKIIHDRFKTRMEKVTALNANSMQIEGVHKVTYYDQTYLIGAESDDVFFSNSKEFNAKLKRVCNKAGIRYLSSHKIRFYMITKLYIGNAPEEDIQYLAGHTDASMTKHYRRISTNAEKIRNDLAKIIPFDEVSVRYQSDKPRKVL